MKLKIDHHSDSPERHRVELSIDDGSGAKAAGAFEFSLTPADQERLRWYWEDYLDYPIEPASDEARDAERRIEEVGTELFQGVFRDSAASRLWSKVQPRLASTRIEISAPAPTGESSDSLGADARSGDRRRYVKQRRVFRAPAVLHRD